MGGEESSATPAERGDMGNAQKKPHGRGDGGPHNESNNSHHGNWRSRGGSADKYKVTQEKVANGSSKRGSTASSQGDQSGGSKGTPAGGNAPETVNLDAPCGALPPPLSRLKNEGNLLFKNGQFADALDKYSQAIQGYADSGKSEGCSLLTVFMLLYSKVAGSSSVQQCAIDIGGKLSMCLRVIKQIGFILTPFVMNQLRQFCC